MTEKQVFLNYLKDFINKQIQIDKFFSKVLYTDYSPPGRHEFVYVCMFYDKYGNMTHIRIYDWFYQHLNCYFSLPRWYIKKSIEDLIIKQHKKDFIWNIRRRIRGFIH